MSGKISRPLLMRMREIAIMSNLDILWPRSLWWEEEAPKNSGQLRKRAMRDNWRKTRPVHIPTSIWTCYQTSTMAPNWYPVPPDRIVSLVTPPPLSPHRGASLRPPLLSDMVSDISNSNKECIFHYMPLHTWDRPHSQHLRSMPPPCSRRVYGGDMIPPPYQYWPFMPPLLHPRHFLTVAASVEGGGVYIVPPPRQQEYWKKNRLISFCLY